MQADEARVMFAENDALAELRSGGVNALQGKFAKIVSFEKLKHDTKADIENEPFENSTDLESSRTAIVAVAISPALMSDSVKKVIDREVAGCTLMMLTTLSIPEKLAKRVMVEPPP